MTKKKPKLRLRRSQKHLKDPDLAHRYDFDLRKSIHLQLYKETKKELDIMKIRLGLSLQDMLECCAQEIVNNNNAFIKALNEYRIRKDSRESREAMSVTDIDSIYDILDEKSPLNDNS